MAPIRIQAQALHGRQPAGDAAGAFSMAAADSSVRPADRACERTGEWLDADVDRAIAAAERAGLASYRVEIGPDGTITIVVGPSGDQPGEE